ncbi:MAG: cyclic-phosphate processing receiver domain-containing protein [Phycisphaerales bacterium]
MKSWCLYLDDLRSPPADGRDYLVARTPDEAMGLIRARGLPAFMSLDHDLGPDLDTMQFLQSLYREFPHPPSFPEYHVHSANPVGRANIISFLESWRRSL